MNFSLKNKFIFGLFIIVLIGWETYSLSKQPIDTIPDVTNKLGPVYFTCTFIDCAGSRKFYNSAR